MTNKIFLDTFFLLWCSWYFRSTFQKCFCSLQCSLLRVHLCVCFALFILGRLHILPLACISFFPNITMFIVFLEVVSSDILIRCPVGCFFVLFNNGVLNNLLFIIREIIFRPLLLEGYIIHSDFFIGSDSNFYLLLCCLFAIRKLAFMYILFFVIYCSVLSGNGTKMLKIVYCFQSFPVHLNIYVFIFFPFCFSRFSFIFLDCRSCFSILKLTDISLFSLT